MKIPRLRWLLLVLLLALHVVPGMPLFLLILADTIAAVLIVRSAWKRVFYRIYRKLFFSGWWGSFRFWQP